MQVFWDKSSISRSPDFRSLDAGSKAREMQKPDFAKDSGEALQHWYGQQLSSL